MAIIFKMTATTGPTIWDDSDATACAVGTTATVYYSEPQWCDPVLGNTGDSQARAEQERREESARQFDKVLTRQRRRFTCRRKTRIIPQVTSRKPLYPHRLSMGNANRYD